MIWLLIPTRHNSKRLIECLRSFQRNAANIANYKVILRIDRDDLDTINDLLEIQQFKNVSWIIGQPTEFHKAFQELSDVVPEGDFVWLLYDNCLVEGARWDEEILGHIPHEGCVGYAANDELHAILPNKCWEQFGHKGFGNFTYKWLGFVLCEEAGWQKVNLKGVTITQKDYATSAH